MVEAEIRFPSMQITTMLKTVGYRMGMSRSGSTVRWLLER